MKFADLTSTTQSNRVYIIAEVGVNHNGNEDLAFRLIDLAADGGADAIKFQMFVPELLCSAVYRQDEINMLRQYIVSRETLAKWRDYALRKNLEFIVTPFDFESLADVASLQGAAIKIASGELTHIPFLQKAASYGQPLIISTGASYLSDVERAVAAVAGVTNTPPALLHCASVYPAPDDCLNLRAVTTLMAAFPQCVVGFSDHSIGSGASSIAVTLGAQIIEKHITLDKSLAGPDHTASADQKDFFEMVRVIRAAEAMLGSGAKVPQPCELKIGRSLVAARDMAAGDVLALGDIDCKRPAGGIPAYQLDKFIGATLTKAIRQDELLAYEHVIRFQ